jgi:hypothetical protein
MCWKKKSWRIRLLSRLEYLKCRDKTSTNDSISNTAGNILEKQKLGKFPDHKKNSQEMQLLLNNWDEIEEGGRLTDRYLLPNSQNNQLIKKKLQTQDKHTISKVFKENY